MPPRSRRGSRRQPACTFFVWGAGAARGSRPPLPAPAPRTSIPPALSPRGGGLRPFPPAPRPRPTHLAAPRSPRRAQNWAPARTRSCSRSSCAARCRTERRPRHCPAPAGRAGRERAAELSGHPGSLRCRRRPRRRRRRCRCAPGLRTASWASLGRARRASAGPRLGGERLRPQRRPGSEWSGAGRPAGCRGLRGSLLSAGRSGSLRAVRAGQWLQEPPPGSPPRAAGGRGGGRARAAAARAPECPAGWPQCRARSEQASDSSVSLRSPSPAPPRPPARPPSLSAFSSWSSPPLD